MDWSRAKTILIFIFLALNIFLIYNMAAEESKVITIAQKDILDVQSILQKNNIILKAQVPNKISPKSFLKIEDASYKENDLVKNFLGGSQGAQKVAASGVTTYKKGLMSLEIYPNKKIVFTNEPNDNIKGFSQKEIENYAESYLKAKDMFPMYAQESGFILSDGGYELKYKQVFHDNEIFPSYMDIKLSDKGITKIESLWFSPVGFIDDAKDIKTPLEELFVFAKDVENKDKITIDDISLGYYLSDDIQNASVSAVPAWRIKVSDGYTYYYNAYEGYLEGKNKN